MFILSALAGVVAGLVNALAGGGPILTLLALSFAGVDPRTASLTSTTALLPGQALTGLAGWRRLAPSLPFTTAPLIAAAVGGGAGALLLVTVPLRFFSAIVPFLVAFATLAYVANTYRRRSAERAEQPRRLQASGSAVTAVLGTYGGFFGGGNSFLLLAVFSFLGLDEKRGNAAKNVFVCAINGAAAVVFVGSGLVDWTVALGLCVGNLAGSALALKVIDKIPASWLYRFVVAAGVALTAYLAAKAFL